MAYNLVRGQGTYLYMGYHPMFTLSFIRRALRTLDGSKGIRKKHRIKIFKTELDQMHRLIATKRMKHFNILLPGQS